MVSSFTWTVLSCFALLFTSSVTGYRVLEVVTNIGQWQPQTGPVGIAGEWKPTGYWLVEFTHSYDVFKSAGWEIDVASPTGGLGPADPQGFIFYANDPISQQYVAKNTTTNTFYVPLTQNTLSINSVDPSRYDAIFLVGGTGAMFDFPFSKGLKDVVRYMWEHNKVVAAVCHGPVALADLTLSDGSYLVSGKLMTGFSNDEEQSLGYANACVFCQLPSCDPATCQGPYMPTEYYLKRNHSNGMAGLDNTGSSSFLVESQLKLRGAKYVATYQNWTSFYFRPHVVVDGRFVTGQNPGAGFQTAQAAVTAVERLGKNCPSTNMVLQSTFCTPIQQLPTDPPTVCTTEGKDLCSSSSFLGPSLFLLFLHFLMV